MELVTWDVLQALSKEIKPSFFIFAAHSNVSKLRKFPLAQTVFLIIS